MIIRNCESIVFRVSVFFFTDCVLLGICIYIHHLIKKTFYCRLGFRILVPIFLIAPIYPLQMLITGSPSLLNLHKRKNMEVRRNEPY